MSVILALLVPAFILALLPGTAPRALTNLLTWANTVALLALAAATVAGALSGLSCACVWGVLKYKKATKVCFTILSYHVFQWKLNDINVQKQLANSFYFFCILHPLGL